MMKKTNHSYPTSAYIFFIVHEENGKVKSMMPNPEILNNLEGIKETVDTFNTAMGKKGRKESIDDAVSIVRLELIDIFPYSAKKWNNPKYIIKKNDVLVSCFKLLNDYNSKYRVLIAPCKDNKGRVWQTIQSVYRSSSNILSWKTLLHSDNPIVDGTKYVALYKCWPPEIYVTDMGVVATHPPKGSKENPKNIRKV